MTTLTEPATITARRSSRLMWAILGLVLAMKVTLIVVLALTALSLPVVGLMPRKAPSEPHQ